VPVLEIDAARPGRAVVLDTNTESGVRPSRTGLHARRIQPIGQANRVQTAVGVRDGNPLGRVTTAAPARNRRMPTRRRTPRARWIACSILTRPDRAPRAWVG